MFPSLISFLLFYILISKVTDNFILLIFLYTSVSPVSLLLNSKLLVREHFTVSYNLVPRCK